VWLVSPLTTRAIASALLRSKAHLAKPESITVPISVSSLMEEPAHVHVRSGDGSEAKFWLSPQVRLASNDGFDARTLRELATEVQDKQTMIEEHWHEYFG
jgi:hypothetical protein